MRTRNSLSYSVPSYAPSWGWPELSATFRCLITGQIVHGPDTKRFTQQIGDFLDLPYVLPMNRGRRALELAVQAVGVKESDEVLMPSFLCDAALQAVQNTGAKPVLADLGDGFHLDPASIRSRMTARTKCVIVPHLFGEMAPIDAIEKDLEGTGIALIDDAAQAFGTRLDDRCAGTFGDCGIISTGLGKPLEGAAGGALVTRNREIYEQAKSLCQGDEGVVAVLRRALAGWVWYRLRRYTLPFKAGSDSLLSTNQNVRIKPKAMSNLDAAIATEQLAHLERNTGIRRRRAAELVSALGSSERHCTSDLSPSSMILVAVLLLQDHGPRADETVSTLRRLGIEARRGYDPLHRTMGLSPEGFPKTEELWERLVLIPLTRALSTRQKQAIHHVLSADSNKRATN